MQLVEGHRPIAPPHGVSPWDADPYDPAILASPEEFYRELRDRGPFVYLSRYAMLACGRHDEVETVFNDNHRFVSGRGVGLQDFALGEPWRPPSLLLEADAPAHSRVRKVMMRAMSAKMIRSLQTLFAEHAAALADSVVARAEVDGVRDIARVFPTTVIPAAIGMKDINVDFIVHYGQMVFNGIGPDNAIRQKSLSRANEVVPWITAACQRDRISDGGIGALIHAAADTGELQSDECAMLVRSLLSAGVDTTIAAIGSALLCLARYPDALASIKADPSLTRPFFEEVIRFTSPAHSFSRTANEDVQISNVEIEEGTKILCVMGAANLDERRWAEPDRFDVERRPGGHLGFGSGIHRCVGQALARVEVESLIAALASRISRIDLIGEPEWEPSNGVHGLGHLPIRLVV